MDPPRRDDDQLMQQRMEQVQRSEGLATFAASIAHDFNNALSVLISGLTLIENKLGPTDTLTDVLADMRMAAVGSSQLALRLMQLGRIGEVPDVEAVEVSSLVNRTAGVMRRRIPASMLINVEVPEGLVVPGFEVELHLVLINLIANARDAMPAGGTLTITAQRTTLDAAQAAANLVPAPGEYVAVSVRDTGNGMDPATKARVFEPFFTTKPPDKGAGLGLAMVQGILKRHRGAISVESSVGAGSTFTIWLPVA